MDANKTSCFVCVFFRKIFLDGLPYIGTSSSVRLMKEIISNGEVPESTVNEWVISIAFTSRPDDDTMEVSARLLEEQTFSPNIALSVASLSHTYCRLYPDCRNNQAVSTIVQYLESKIRHFYHDYHDSKRDVKENVSMLFHFKYCLFWLYGVKYAYASPIPYHGLDFTRYNN